MKVQHCPEPHSPLYVGSPGLGPPHLKDDTKIDLMTCPAAVSKFPARLNFGQVSDSLLNYCWEPVVGFWEAPGGAEDLMYAMVAAGG